MKINDPVRFKSTDHTCELSANQAAAVGAGIGVVTAVETRDGIEHVNVLFAVYGATFSGIPTADLEPLSFA